MLRDNHWSLAAFMPPPLPNGSIEDKNSYAELAPRSLIPHFPTIPSYSAALRMMATGHTDSRTVSGPSASPPGPSKIVRIVNAYQLALRIACGCAPPFAVGYLYFQQSIPAVLRNYPFHEIAIGTSILLSLFVAWVTWRCYVTSREPALRFMTLAFLGFAVIYAPHGILTRQDCTNQWLFILYGPASRVAMCGLLLASILNLGHPPEPADDRGSFRRRWLPWRHASPPPGPAEIYT